jgi:hypothetical protein
MSTGVRAAAADAVEDRSTLPPFVGRDAELQELRQAWRLAVAGNRQILLVSGDPGIGKTTLADVLAAEARANGGWVLTGSAPPGRAVPYAPVVDALTEAARSAPLDVLARRPLLAHVVPEIGARLGGSPPTPHDREQLFWDAVGLLGDLCDVAPLLLILDDLHRADRSTVRLLEYVLPRTGDCPMLVVAAYCNTSVDRADPFSSLLAQLHADREVGHMVLPGIARTAVPDLLPSASVLDAVWARSEGNPLFLAELLRHVDPSLPTVDPRTLPRSVELGVTRRLARLDSLTRQLLAVASLVGDEFSLELVAASGEVPWSSISEAADEALDAAIIQPVAGTPRFQFTHEVVRLAVERRVALHRGVQVHGKIAKALEESPARSAADVARLAFHSAAAAPVGGSMSAARYAGLAGDQAMTVLAYDEAAGWYGQALGLVTGIGRESSDVRSRLLLNLADAHDRSGDKVRARAAYLEAAALAKLLGDDARLSRATHALADQVAAQVPTIDRPAPAATAAPRPAPAWAPAIRTVTPSVPPPVAPVRRITPPTPPDAPAAAPAPSAAAAPAAPRARRRPARLSTSAPDGTAEPKPASSPKPAPASNGTTLPRAKPAPKAKAAKAAKAVPKAKADAAPEPPTEAGAKARPTRPTRPSRRPQQAAGASTSRTVEPEDLAEITGLTADLAESETRRAGRAAHPAAPPVPELDPADFLDMSDDDDTAPAGELDSAWAGVYDPRPTTTWVRETSTGPGTHSHSHGRVVSSLRARHSRVWGPEDLEERLRASDQIIEMATASEDDDLALEGYGWRLIDRLEMGRIVQADEDIAAHRLLANASGDPRHRRDAATWAVMRALLDGRYLDARSAMTDVVAFGERARDPHIAAMACAAQQYWLTLEWGSDDELADLLESHRTRIPRGERGPGWRAALALLLARSRRFAEACEELDAISDHELQARPHDAVWLQMAACAVEAADLVGDTRTAVALAPHLDPFAERVVVGARGLVCLGSAARYAGQAVAMLEEWDLADGYFDLALQVNRRLGSPPQLAHTQAAWGHALMARGRRTDRKRGESMMTAGAAVADDLEMRRLAAATRLRRGGR